MDNQELIGYDGDDAIIYSKTFIVYENKLTISGFLDKTFVFTFEKEDPQYNQKDVSFKWAGNELLVTFSKKFRNTLGSGTTEKLKILEKDSNYISFSAFGHQIGQDGLFVVINFYLGQNKLWTSQK